MNYWALKMLNICKLYTTHSPCLKLPGRIRYDFFSPCKVNGFFDFPIGNYYEKHSTTKQKPI